MRWSARALTSGFQFEQPRLKLRSPMPETPEETSVEPRPLSRELREAFAEAVQDDRLWSDAKADPQAFLHEKGVREGGVSVAFLDVERSGDRIRYIGADGQVILDMFCPPERVWWHFCRKLMRVCEKHTIRIDDEPKIVEFNCVLVCEESIWDDRPTLPKRPPFPPLPLHERISAVE